MRVHKLTIKGPDQSCGLHACLRHALRLARWAGFFPVQGLGQNSVNETRFKIKCVYSYYFVATFIGQVLMVCFSIMYLFQNGNDLYTITGTIFFVVELISAMLLLKLSQQWPDLIAKAAETEKGMTELKLDNKTVLQTSVIPYVVMAFALVEYILSVSLNLRFVMSCLQETEITSNVIENHVENWLAHVFNYIPYSAFSAFLFECISFQTNFLWSFNDVIIICFSIYITSYFRILNKVIARNVMDKDTISWGRLRVHHSNLVKLVKEIDLHISSFILIALFTDLYFICFQLFNSLHRDDISFQYCDEVQIQQVLRSPLYLLYYMYSFAFLVIRTLVLSLFASNVHCASLELVYSIYDLPSSVYDIEVKRFQLQLHHTEVVLTGKFFKVNRNMILKVVGTIITYEIVLLQYSITSETSNNDSTMATIFKNVTNVYGQHK